MIGCRTSLDNMAHTIVWLRGLVKHNTERAEGFETQAQHARAAVEEARASIEQYLSALRLMVGPNEADRLIAAVEESK